MTEIREREKFFNVHEDAELEAASVAYVQTAIQRNISKSQAKNIVDQIWKEITDNTNKENNAIQKLNKRLLRGETIKQEKFRRKVEKFVKHYPQMDLFYEFTPSQTSNQLTIDVICFMYKALTYSKHLTHEVLMQSMCNHFAQTFDDPELSNRSFLCEFVGHIFNCVRNFSFKMERTWDGTNSLYDPQPIDHSFTPVLFSDRAIDVTDFTSIMYVSDAVLKRDAYPYLRNNDTDNIINLVWIIETFF